MAGAAAAPVSDAAPVYPSRTTGWLTVAILFLLYILSLTDRNIMALMVGPIKADLGLSDFQISLLQGPAFALLFAICAIPAGIALDRYSRRWVLYLSVTVWSIGAAACGLATGFASLFVARAIVGAGESGFGTGSYSVIGDSFPPQRVGLAMAIFIMGGVMGAGFVFLIGGPLVGAMMELGPTAWPVLGVLQPWQKVFLATGLPGLVLALLVFAFAEPPRTRRPDVAGYGEAIGFIRGRAALFTAILLGFGLAYAATIGFQLWTPSYLARVHGWTPARVGVVLGITQVAAAATMPLHGWIVDRLYARGRRDAHLLWCAAMLCVAAPFGIGAFLVPSAEATVVLFGLFMACILATAGMGPAVTQVVTPVHLRGRVSAIYVLVTGLIALGAGPSFVGFVTDIVFADERAVGSSLIVSVLCVALPAALLMLVGARALRTTPEPVP